MARSTQSERDLPCRADANGVAAESRPCGHGGRRAELRPFAVPYLTASPAICCAYCRTAGRPLWWGICGWCGAEEQDFDAE